RSYDPVRLPPWPASDNTVEAATLAQDGSPPMTRITLPTCRAHDPGGSSGCMCRLLPRSRGLPQMAGGSASALSLPRPAQASLTLQPIGLLSRLTATFVTRLRPVRLPGQTARQRPDQSTTLWVESSSTGDPRLRGALPFPDVRVREGYQLKLSHLLIEGPKKTFAEFFQSRDSIRPLASNSRNDSISERERGSG